MTILRIIQLAECSIVVLILSGCMPVFPKNDGMEIPYSRVADIQPGITMREQLQDWFGTPIAIAAQGEIVKIRQPKHWAPGPRIVQSVDQQLQSDTLFELFKDKHQLESGHRVYYYFHSTSKMHAWFLGLYINEKAWVEVDKLWVLVNEDTGLVESYVYHPFNKNEYKE